MMESTELITSAAIAKPAQMTVHEVTPEVARLRPAQKAAIILVSMGPEYAAPLLEKMPDHSVENFVTALESLQLVSHEVVLGVMADFITKLEKLKTGLNLGPNKARTLAESFIDEPRARRIFGKSAPVDTSNMSDAQIWEQLAEKPALEIAGFLAEQRTELAVFVLSELQDEFAGEVLGELPDDKAVLYATRLSQGIDTPDHTKRAVAQIIKASLLDSGGAEADGLAIGFVANLLSIVSKERRDMVLSGIEKTDKDRAQKIRNGMLTLEDIPQRLPPTAVSIIFKEADKEMLKLAMKAGEAEAKESVDFLLANISQRLAGQFREDMDDMPAPEGKAADKAIAALMGMISKLDRDGRIVLIKKAEDTSEAA